MTGRGVPFVDPAPALVFGRAAVGVAWLLRWAVERGALESLPESVRAETVPAIAACDLAARAWTRRRPDDADDIAVSGAGSGTSAARVDGGGASSPHDVVSVAEAACLLNVGERRMRDLAAAGLGRRVGGRWVLDRAAVYAEARRRGAA